MGIEFVFCIYSVNLYIWFYIIDKYDSTLEQHFGRIFKCMIKIMASMPS